MMDISFSDECGYMTAPTSAASSITKEMFFYSAPTSPSKLIASARKGYQTNGDANSNLDEFEFETSMRFNGDVGIKASQDEYDDKKPCYDQRPNCGGGGGNSLMQTMSFADELFSDGKVLPLMKPPPPLKPPPRMHQIGDCGMTRSPGSAPRLRPFSRHSLWNDDFDPFMVAMEKVREDNRGKTNTRHDNGLRRTRSLSPFRGFQKQKQAESHCCELQKEPLLKEASSGRVDMVSESKGLTFEPKRASSASKETKKDDESKRGGFWTRIKMGESIVKFLFGSGQHKLEDQRLNRTSVASLESTQWGKDETKCDMNRMRLVCHKPRGPRLFLCLGHDGGYVK